MKAIMEIIKAAEQSARRQKQQAEKQAEQMELEAKQEGKAGMEASLTAARLEADRRGRAMEQQVEAEVAELLQRADTEAAEVFRRAQEKMEQTARQITVAILQQKGL